MTAKEQCGGSLPECNLLTIKEVAEFFRVTPDRVSRWIKTGKLRAFTLCGGRSKRVKREDLDALLGEYTP